MTTRATSQSPPSRSTTTASEAGHQSPPNSPAALTLRQREVLDLLAAGASSKQAARTLGVSVRTIHKHLETAYRALGVTTRIQALRAVGHLDRPLSNRSMPNR